MTVRLAPELAAATRLTHGDYQATLAGRQQREIDVQEVAGALILMADRQAQTEEALRESTRLLQAIAKRVPALVDMVDERVLANTEALRLDVPEGGR